MKYMDIDYNGIRKRAEEEMITLTDKEFLNVVFLCTRKIEMNGLDAEYMNLLLPDEIRHYAFRREVNKIAFTVIREEMEEMRNGTDYRKTVPCRCRIEPYQRA